jgi:hypothetical protein
VELYPNCKKFLIQICSDLGSANAIVKPNQTPADIPPRTPSAHHISDPQFGNPLSFNRENNWGARNIRVQNPGRNCIQIQAAIIKNLAGGRWAEVCFLGRANYAIHGKGQVRSGALSTRPNLPAKPSSGSHLAHRTPLTSHRIARGPDVRYDRAAI